MVCSETGSDRTLSVFLQDPCKQHSVNSVMVSSGWAEATGVGSVTAEFYQILGKVLSCVDPLPSTRQHPSYGDCLEVKREYYQNSPVLDCVTQCSQSAAHLCEQFKQIGFVTLWPLHCAFTHSLCLHNRRVIIMDRYIASHPHNMVGDTLCVTPGQQGEVTLSVW